MHFLFHGCGVPGADRKEATRQCSRYFAPVLQAHTVRQSLRLRSIMAHNHQDLKAGCIGRHDTRDGALGVTVLEYSMLNLAALRHKVTATDKNFKRREIMSSFIFSFKPELCPRFSMYSVGLEYKPDGRDPDMRSLLRSNSVKKGSPEAYCPGTCNDQIDNASYNQLVM